MRRIRLRGSRGPSGLLAKGPRAAALAAGCSLCALLVAGCGEASQDAKEPHRTFTIAISQTSFPARQAISKPTTLTIAVHNVGSRPLPDVAVTIDSLTYRAKQPVNLADPQRPTWIVYSGPGPVANPPVESEEITKAGGGQTASLHTWALGRLAPGATKVFAWRLLPVVSGVKTVHYAIAAGLHGKAMAQLQGGGSPVGSFTVHIAPAPRLTRVNPETGAVLQGPYSAAPGPVGAVP